MAQSRSFRGKSGLKGLDKEAQGFLRGGKRGKNISVDMTGGCTLSVWIK